MFLSTALAGHPPGDGRPSSWCVINDFCGAHGERFPNHGVYLEVIPGKQLVLTDTYISAWVPSAKPFMTGVLTFDHESGKTRYTARVYHWSEADMKQHEQVDFVTGWGKATDQLKQLLAGKPIVG